MFRSCRPVLFALLLLAAVHLQPVYRVSVEGECIAGLFSRDQILEARQTAHEAAEELAVGEAALSVPNVSLRLGLRRPDGDTAALVEALLRTEEAILSGDAVRINGIGLGTVADGEALLEQLRQTIRSGTPSGASVGRLGGTLEIVPVYTRADRLSENGDVLARILAMAPVFYLDSGGKLV